MEDGPLYTAADARRRVERDGDLAVRVRWAMVAAYVLGVALMSRHGVTDLEIGAATVVGAVLVAAFLSAGWICGRSWRD